MYCTTSSLKLEQVFPRFLHPFHSSSWLESRRTKWLLYYHSSTHMTAFVSQPWLLSQSVNKAKGICSVCHATRQLHLAHMSWATHGSQTWASGWSVPISIRPPHSVIATQVHHDLAPALRVTSQIASPTASNPVYPCFYGDLIKHIIYEGGSTGICQLVHYHN